MDVITQTPVWVLVSIGFISGLCLGIILGVYLVYQSEKIKDAENGYEKGGNG